jgi:hypothetical protein
LGFFRERRGEGGIGWDGNRRELAQGLWMVFLYINEWKRERVRYLTHAIV